MEARFPWHALAGLGSAGVQLAGWLQGVPIPGPGIAPHPVFSIPFQVACFKAVCVWGMNSHYWRQLRDNVASGKLGPFKPVAEFCFEVKARVGNAAHSLEFKYDHLKQELLVRRADGQSLPAQLMQKLREVMK